MNGPLNGEGIITKQKPIHKKIPDDTNSLIGVFPRKNKKPN